MFREVGGGGPGGRILKILAVRYQNTGVPKK
jgi:hypothetical protein